MRPDRYERTERAVYHPAQTHLREYDDGDPDLYPSQRELVADGGGAPFVATDRLDLGAGLETAVYAHRDPTSDAALSDFVYVSYDHNYPTIEAADHPSMDSVTEWVEAAVIDHYDGADRALDDLLMPEDERVDADRDPTRVGTLHIDTDTQQVVALRLDPNAFSADGDATAATDGQPQREGGDA